MRWYVSQGGETQRATEEAQLVELLKSGKIRRDAHVRDEDGGQWTPVLASPFGAQVPKEVASPDHLERFGTALVAVPLLAAALILAWVGQMNLLEGPGSALSLLGFGTIAMTAILTYLDAKQVSAGQPADVDKRGKRPTSAAAWAGAVTLFWLFGYPGWLFARRRYGLRNLGFFGLLVALFFCGSWFAMGEAIAAKQAEIRNSLASLGQPAEAVRIGREAHPTQARVTRAQYEHIREGMTYQEVVEVLGAEGREVTSSEMAGITTVMYEWSNGDASSMNAMFQNGQLVVTDHAI